MRGLIVILASCIAAPCAALPLETSLSETTAKTLAPAEARAESSALARRLLAAAKSVSRREIRGADMPDAIGVRGGDKPEIVVDPALLPAAAPDDLEILLVLNSARAAFAFPIAIVEGEQAAWQNAVQFAAERGADDPAGFGARLKGAVSAAAALGGALERRALPARSAWEPSPTPVFQLPSRPFERAALLLHLFERDPQRFYWALEQGTAWPEGSARLGELEDLYALRAKELAALKGPPRGPYAYLGGRRYASPLVRSAFLLRGTGAVERLRESLEAYDTVGLVSTRVAVNRWRRTGGR